MTEVEDKKTVLPFERQPRETDKAFAAFRVYLELGPERSLAEVCKKLGKGKTVIESWSSKYDWAARVAAHGAHLALVEREASEAAARATGVDWVKRQEPTRVKAWEEAQDLIAMAEEFKQRWRDTSRVPGFESVVRALELAFKLMQFATGMPSEVKQVQTTVTGADGGPIRVEFEAALKKVYGRRANTEKVKDVIEAEVINTEDAKGTEIGKTMDGKMMKPPTEGNEVNGGGK